MTILVFTYMFLFVFRLQRLSATQNNVGTILISFKYRRWRRFWFVYAKKLDDMFKFERKIITMTINGYVEGKICVYFINLRFRLGGGGGRTERQQNTASNRLRTSVGWRRRSRSVTHGNRRRRHRERSVGVTLVETTARNYRIAAVLLTQPK